MRLHTHRWVFLFVGLLWPSVDAMAQVRSSGEEFKMMIEAGNVAAACMLIRIQLAIALINAGAIAG